MFGILKKYKIGLALSGGGTRGFGHIGFLKALEDYNISPDVISGVSAGAIIGAFYADGWKADDIYKLFSDKNFFDISNVNLPTNGLMNFKGLQKNILEKIKSKKIEDLDKKFYCASLNLNKSKIEYFDKGILIPRVTASASIPVLFSPVIIDGQHYVDGGVIDNLPVKPLLKQCKKIIAGNTNFHKEKDSFKRLSDVMIRVIHIGVNSHVTHSKSKCDIVFEPKELSDFNLLDASNNEEMFKIGFEHAKEVLSKSRL